MSISKCLRSLLGATAVYVLCLLGTSAKAEWVVDRKVSTTVNYLENYGDANWAGGANELGSSASFSAGELPFGIGFQTSTTVYWRWERKTGEGEAPLVSKIDIGSFASGNVESDAWIGATAHADGRQIQLVGGISSDSFTAQNTRSLRRESDGTYSVSVSFGVYCNYEPQSIVNYGNAIMQAGFGFGTPY